MRPPTDLGGRRAGVDVHRTRRSDAARRRFRAVRSSRRRLRRGRAHRCRVGGAVTAPTKIHDVAPGYPRMARDARIQGIVIIQATIGLGWPGGRRRGAAASSRLSQAALHAVRQWRAPPQLNGEPIAVIMTVTVNFKLDDRYVSGAIAGRRRDGRSRLTEIEAFGIPVSTCTKWLSNSYGPTIATCVMLSVPSENAA